MELIETILFIVVGAVVGIFVLLSIIAYTPRKSTMDLLIRFKTALISAGYHYTAKGKKKLWISSEGKSILCVAMGRWRSGTSLVNNCSYYNRAKLYLILYKPNSQYDQNELEKLIQLLKSA